MDIRNSNHQTVIDQDGFPYEFRPEACNFRGESLGSTAKPEHAKLERPESDFFVRMALDRGSEHEQAVRYHLEQLLHSFTGRVTDEAGKSHPAVEFTARHAILRRPQQSKVESRGSTGGRLIEHIFRYNNDGLAKARRILCGIHNTPGLSAEFI